MFKRFFALFAAVGMTGVLLAAEGDLEGRGNRPIWESGRNQMRRRGGPSGRGRMGGSRMGGSMLNRFKAESQISQKYPKEYAEAEKQLLEAEKKLQELAKKAKVELPVSIESRIRELKHKDQAEFAKVAAEENSRKAMHDLMELAKKHEVKLFDFGMRGGRKDGGRPGRGGAEGRGGKDSMRRPQMVDFRKLKKRYPEEMKKLEELRYSNPEEFRKGLRELVKKMEKDAEESAPKK